MVRATVQRIKIMSRLTASRCRDCGTPTFGGWTAEPCALLVTLDAQALNPEQELTALMAGCWTWTLHAVPFELTMRGARTIRQRPAGTRPRQSVHADHRCTAPWRTP